MDALNLRINMKNHHQPTEIEMCLEMCRLDFAFGYAIEQAMDSAKISRDELANKSGVSRSTVDEVIDFGNCVNTEQLARLGLACGIRWSLVGVQHDDISTVIVQGGLVRWSGQRPIKVWPWNHAPKYYQALSPHGGDEDWVALIPSEMANKYIGWTEAGSPFGICDVSEHYLENGDKVLIGAHA